MSRIAACLHRMILLLGRCAPQRYRELVRGMLAEFDSIPEPPEQVRFALGAVLAVGRLTLRAGAHGLAESLRTLVSAPFTRGAHFGGPAMSEIMTRDLLRRLSRPFAVGLVALTLLVMANQVIQWMPQLHAQGASTWTLAEVVLLSLPFTLALTVPMAVFLSVCWVFARLGKEGLLASASRFRRLVVPVVGAAAVIASFTLVLNSEVLPRANSRLVTVLTGSAARPTERTMTMGQLRNAAQNARATSGVQASARAAAYEVEIQKRLALPAACMVFALVGAAVVFRFPRGGVGLVVAGSGLLFAGYYSALIAGESLADQQVVSAGVAMWMANAVLLCLALVLAWRPSSTRS